MQTLLCCYLPTAIITIIIKLLGRNGGGKTAVDSTEVTIHLVGIMTIIEYHRCLISIELLQSMDKLAAATAIASTALVLTIIIRIYLENQITSSMFWISNSLKLRKTTLGSEELSPGLAHKKLQATQETTKITITTTRAKWVVRITIIIIINRVIMS